MNKKPHYLLIIILPVIKFIIPDGRYGDISIYVDFLIIPALILALGFYMIIANKMTKQFFVFALLAIISANLIGYILWGIKADRLFAPDLETIMIIEWILVFQVCAVLILGTLEFLVFVIKRVRKAGT